MHCTKCGAAIAEGRETCAHCGTRAPERAPAAERRQLTVLFCDLVGSVALADSLDPEDFHDLILAYRRAAVQAIEACGGNPARFVGDGILAYFGYPVAHEDSARRAVRAGLDIVRAIAGPDIPRPRSGANLAVRIGIHTGLAVVGDIGAGSTREAMGVLGEAPNVAARFQSEAEPGSVVFGSETHRLVANHFECRPLGARQLKGLKRTFELYAAIAERPWGARAPAATPFVGRSAELALLAERWHSAVAGDGQAVLISGDPGMGKTRLVDVFAASLAEEAPTILSCGCSPFTEHSAWFPLTELLRRLLGIDARSADDEVRERIGTAVATLGLAAEPSERALLYLLSVSPPAGAPPWSPQQQRQAVHDAAIAALDAAGARRPILLVVEDLHWLDASTRELLDGLLRQLSGRRVLMLLTARSHAVENLDGPPSLTRLPLGPLRAEQVAALVRGLCGNEAAREALVRNAVAKTDGNPLFVEEFTKAALESGDTVGRDGEGQAAIPLTLRDSLLARLDRLGPARRLAQVAAVLGQSFPLEHLRAIAPVTEPAFSHQLDRLVAAGILELRGTPPNIEASYRHALIQSAAYDTLLVSTRRAYHARIGETIITQHAALADEHPELVAHHFAAAHLGARAIDYWRRAAQRAAERGAYEESIAHLSQALDSLPDIETEETRARTELDLRLQLGPRYAHARGNAAPESREAFGRARELCETVRDPHALFAATRGLMAYYLVLGHMATARRLGEGLLDLAGVVGEPAYSMLADRVLGLTHFLMGNLALGSECLDRAITLLREGNQPRAREYFAGDAGALAMCNRAWLAWFMGAPGEAQRRMDEALDFAPVEGDPHARTFVLGYASGLALCRGEAGRAYDLASETLTLAREHGLEYWIAWGQAVRGWALAKTVDAGEGLAELRAGIAAYAATGAGQMRSFFLMLAGELLAEQGDRAAALAMLEDALATAHATGVRVHEPEIQRLIAVVAAAAGRPPAIVEQALVTGRDLARAQGGRMLELRCLATGAALIIDPAAARAWRSERDALIEALGGEAAAPEIRTLLDASRPGAPSARLARAPCSL